MDLVNKAFEDNSLGRAIGAIAAGLFRTNNDEPDARATELLGLKNGPDFSLSPFHSLFSTHTSFSPVLNLTLSL